MTENIKTFEIALDLDEAGEIEEFTWDLSPLIDSTETLHLNENGLPAEGTILKPGMILVGKIGKSKWYGTCRKPTSLELNALSIDDLRINFGHLWTDASIRVPDECNVEVIESRLKMSDTDRPTAIVRVRLIPN